MSNICERRKSVIEVNLDDVKSGEDSTSVEISETKKSGSKEICGSRENHCG